MVRIILIRHGETTWNTDCLLYTSSFIITHLPTLLTKKRQARRLPLFIHYQFLVFHRKCGSANRYDVDACLLYTSKEWHKKYPSHGYRWLRAKLLLDTGLFMSCLLYTSGKDCSVYVVPIGGSTLPMED